MRPLIWGILLCIALTVGGTFAARLAGLHADWSGAMAALAVGIFALVLAAVPLELTRGISPMTSVQIGLAATLIHMFVLLVAAAVVLLGKIPVGPTFIFWLMAMYLITLIALVAYIIARSGSSSSGVSTTFRAGSHA